MLIGPRLALVRLPFQPTDLQRLAPLRMPSRASVRLHGCMAVSIQEAFEQSPVMLEFERFALDGARRESDAKRHHFVPRFLLARFLDAARGDQRILQLDVSSGKN